jgi:hypothetical protein
MKTHNETIALFGARQVIRSSYPEELDTPPLFAEYRSTKEGLFADEDAMDFTSVAPRWWPCDPAGLGDRNENAPPCSF